jgi:hypothetical protein
VRLQFHAKSGRKRATTVEVSLAWASACEPAVAMTSHLFGRTARFLAHRIDWLHTGAGQNDARNSVRDGPDGVAAALLIANTINAGADIGAIAAALNLFVCS